MEVDMRAVSPVALKEIDAQFKKIVADAVEAENATRSTANGKITADINLIGDRPSGTTPPDSAALKQIAATMRVYDKVPVWETSSTDANIPISRGIPAIAIGGGGAGGETHTDAEWFENRDGSRGVSRAALMLAALAADR